VCADGVILQESERLRSHAPLESNDFQDEDVVRTAHLDSCRRNRRGERRWPDRPREWGSL